MNFQCNFPTFTNLFLLYINVLDSYLIWWDWLPSEHWRHMAVHTLWPQLHLSNTRKNKPLVIPFKNRYMHDCDIKAKWIHFSARVLWKNNRIHLKQNAINIGIKVHAWNGLIIPDYVYANWSTAKKRNGSPFIKELNTQQ